MPPRRSRSLRTALQSSTLIAVLAGYGLLLAVGAGLAGMERRHAHRQLVTTLAEGLGNGSDNGADLGRYRPFGLEARLEAAGPGGPGSPVGAAPLQLQHNRKGESWLESRTVLRAAAGAQRVLVVRQNVTASIARQRTLLLLLLASAGLASLFTAALLRPVLRRDLLTPIEALCARLQAISGPQWSSEPLLPEADQPRELQPIATAFGALQRRLAAAWGRERSFTDGAAHELRTPITLISGQAQSLLRHPLLPQQRTAVQAIAREAEHMGHLVRDLLDLSRQDGGRLQLLRQRLDPEALVLEAFDRLRPLAPERLVLADAAFGPAPPPLHADRERLLQCLSALVDNALAYSDGTVELAVSQAAAAVVWHVRDRGPGVPPEECPLIFERFVRGSAAARTPDHRGSGLGLALVALLMQAMGGDVAVAERSGGGADFQLRLPAM